MEVLIMSMTAKAQVATRTDTAWTTADGPTEVAQLTFAADYADPANAEWAAATPALHIQISVRKDIADGQDLVPGRKVTLTFE